MNLRRSQVTALIDASATSSPSSFHNNAGFSTVTINAGRLVGAHNSYAGLWFNRGESVEAPYPGFVPATANVVNDGDIQGSQFGLDVSGLCEATRAVVHVGNLTSFGAAFKGGVVGGGCRELESAAFSLQTSASAGLDTMAQGRDLRGKFVAGSGACSGND